MRQHAPTSRWILSFLSVAALIAGFIAATPSVAATSSVAVADATASDGSSAERAAVSCWDIKQTTPESPSGRYWLLTPQLQRPMQFYCDMTTDGGGWVLVGRGRDGWSVAYTGKGKAEQVSEPVTGTAAFSPRQLDSNVINGLFGGQRMDQVSPELRVRRATNSSGTAWQEVRMTIGRAERWTWALQGGVAVAQATFNGGKQVNKTTTRDVAADNGFNRLFTFSVVENGWARGMNYGSAVKGDGSATTYLYTTTGSYATPFAQMFIRPKLRAADVKFTAVPDGGTAESTVPAVPNNGSRPQTWGVTGTGVGGTGENATEVQAFAQVGNRMFAGGNFTKVQKGANASGADVIAQPYLAAFDASNGDFVPGFKPPTFNGQVKALAALPGNRLGVGGEFTQVGGKPRAGFVVLDATSGAVDTTWTYAIENRLKGGKVSIRALDVAGDFLYFGGAMTHFSNGSKTSYAKGAGRLKISTRAPDWSWTPEFDGTVTALDVSDDASRVYYAGYFEKAQGKAAMKMAAFSTAGTTAQRIGLDQWKPLFSSAGARYQQAIEASGNKVWVGGAQHSMFSYNKDTFAIEDTNLTHQGGDLQAIESSGGMVYGGCHCEHTTFEGISNWDTQTWGKYDTAMATRFIDSIYFVGAWNSATGRYVPDFTAEMKARGGMGIWAIKIASDGTVWTGGSLVSSVSESGRNQWSGGIARFAIRDHEAPPTPASPKASITNGTAKVSWSASSGAATYEVLRNDRVVAVTSSLTADVPGSAGGDRFFVRAVDAGGNRSASTKVVVAAATQQLISMGQSWKYYASTTAVPSTWASNDFNDTSWASGAAPIGWGSSRIKTTLTPPEGQKRPVVTYYRKAFNIPAGTALTNVKVTLVADDGAGVYINGTEVGRENLPADGALTGTTYATEAPRSDKAWAEKVTYTIPAGLLREGKNTIAISSHVMWRATPDGSVDAEIIARP